MNKTININLAGLFFHIDENAYQRLQHYLRAVSRSFGNTTGAEETMNDIESRIAELFLEKRANEQQVITLHHVEEVITVMGQPEDYEVDDAIFEDQPRSSNSRFSQKLYRDKQNGYIGGVSAGLGHYLRIDPIWIRISWLVLIAASVGWVIPLYIILWIVAPDAITTNQRLEMMGKEVNLNNIGEENARADFNHVAPDETDKSYEATKRSPRFTVRIFSFTGRIIKGFFKLFGKLLGIVLFLLGSFGFIGLIIALITAGSIPIEGVPALELLVKKGPIETNIYLLQAALFFFVGIPLGVIAYLGFKLISHQKHRLPTSLKVASVGLWILSLIYLIVLVIQVASSQNSSYTHTAIERLKIDPEKTFSIQKIAIKHTDGNAQTEEKRHPYAILNDDNQIQSPKIRWSVEATADSLAVIIIKKKAHGMHTQEAKQNTSYIDFDYQLGDSTLELPDMFSIDKDGRWNRQRVDITIALPEGSQFTWDKASAYQYASYLSNKAFDIGETPYLFEIKNGEAVCLDCPTRIDENEKDLFDSE